jgi:tetratricopeptide (TPR) repeat protein
MPLQHLFWTYVEVDRLADAELPAKDMARIARTKLGTENVWYSRATNCLVLADEYQKKYEQAEPLLREWLAITKKQSGADSIAYSNLLARLANNLVEQRKCAEAQTLVEQALQVIKAKKGSDESANEISLLYPMNVQALVYRGTNRLSEAVALHEENVRRARTRLGATNVTTGIYMGYLAATYQQAGRASEAIPLYEEALRLTEKNLFLLSYRRDWKQQLDAAHQAAAKSK